MSDESGLLDHTWRSGLNGMPARVIRVLAASAMPTPDWLVRAAKAIVSLSTASVLHIDEMVFVELVVAGYAGIDDPAVEARPDGQVTRPVLRPQTPFRGRRRADQPCSRTGVVPPV